MLVKHNCLLYLRHHLLLITKAAWAYISNGGIRFI
jgi:hypothetical protein